MRRGGPCALHRTGHRTARFRRARLRRHRPQEPTTRGRPSRRPSTPAAKSAEAGSTFRPANTPSGQLHLRTDVRLYVEAGATLFATLEGTQYDDAKKAALFYGEDLHDIALEGARHARRAGEYEWRLNEHHRPLHPAQPAPDGGRRQAAHAIVPRGLRRKKPSIRAWCCCCAARMCASRV